MIKHRQQLEKIHKEIDDLIDEIASDDQLDDEEAQMIIDLEQAIADKFTDLLSKFGVEIGDERVD